jgi:transcriptional regulator with XRE-family HTH domain
MQWILQDINIGANLRRLRTVAKLTQEQVVSKAQLMGSSMSRTTYAQIESGARNVKASDLIILRAVFNTSYEDILETGFILPE